jgi:hypothetical protein
LYLAGGALAVSPDPEAKDGPLSYSDQDEPDLEVSPREDDADVVDNADDEG